MFSNTAMNGLKGRKAIGAPGDYSNRATKTGKNRGDIITQYKAIGIDLTDTSISRPWTPDGEEVLLEMFAQGLTIWQMAAEINRTWADVASRLYKLGLEERLDPLAWGEKAEEKGRGLWDD